MAINFGLTCRVMMKEIPKKNKSTKMRSENEEKDKLRLLRADPNKCVNVYNIK